MAILASKDRSVRPVPKPAAEATWQAEIREAVRDGAELCRRLGLPPELASQAAAAQFPVFVPPSYLTRIKPGDATDPLLRQVMPLAEEEVVVASFTTDPVGDQAATLHPGVLQKYEGRALSVATGSCAVHCRYCFRRHFPYEEAPHSEAAWDSALRAIAEDPSITEVILSGGDPLMLVDSRVAMLVGKIADLPHIARLRIHTRLPIMIPRRVTDALLETLAGTKLTSVMVIHTNHARELASDVAVALERLGSAGIMLLNQAVLLRGVNDSIVAQRELSERLVAVGVLPYYLHQLDRVAGAAHFEVPIPEGKQIINDLRQQLPGYMVPRYVQEIAGEANKTVLA
ncbi:EF-P beta-lysylation protein EpmB [Bythopirellula polymerisocia]|uniref:L-lysine 2,3-aminomutase n=1 Tax=Bythopirellula polymerisocia TaxID=2528003 RepID=A0A5C6D2N2_9BACT|nr:EF-P beta-lysylation protein EpmB [Bythopirellula polymerisocia]TWU30385.1 L-lysine 2,3-aminomutase [Bythopirellula polymerisocia]